jgi:hypothetical protein
MRKPSHRAYVVTNAKGEKKKAFWREVGVAWPHNRGGGFDIVIHEGISVSGRLVCATPKAAEKEVRDPAGEAWFTLSSDS